MSMRSLELGQTHFKKLSEVPTSFYKSEFKESLKSFFPGEWLLFKDSKHKKIYLGFVNPLVPENYPSVNILKLVNKMPSLSIVEDYLCEKIKSSIEYRLLYEGYEKSSRVIYGESDGLPGLVVDIYENICLVQINSAGMDRYREFIKKTISEIVKLDTFIAEGSKQRTQELLPMYRDPINVSEIILKENNFRYKISLEKIQKNGWYFDHRENRLRFERIINRINILKKSGLDLFCYQGAWGFHLLRAGCERVDFIDQADVSESILSNARCNELFGAYFQRMDVFKWLDEAIAHKKKYNIIVSDPPAFAKKKSEKAGALDGYLKLHKKIIKIAEKKSLVCFASCTQYVSEEEFISTIEQASKHENRRMRILDRGMQAWDHPIQSMESRSNYIKSVTIYLE